MWRTYLFLQEKFRVYTPIKRTTAMDTCTCLCYNWLKSWSKWQLIIFFFNISNTLHCANKNYHEMYSSINWICFSSEIPIDHSLNVEGCVNYKNFYPCFHFVLLSFSCDYKQQKIKRIKKLLFIIVFYCCTSEENLHHRIYTNINRKAGLSEK